MTRRESSPQFAGSGDNGFAGDGKQATKASFDDPEGIAVGPDGTTFISDDDNARIRRVDPSGIITTFAGTGEIGSSGDGAPATDATFTLPNQLLLDPAGNLYVTEEDVPRIRRIDPDGLITTFAGTDTAGNSGDGGPATEAQLSGALGLGADAAGQIYIFDSGSGCVRVVDTSGIISTYWCVDSGFTTQ